MRFPDAARGSGLSEHLNPGLKALRKTDSSRVRGGRSLTGSIDLDEALKDDSPSDNRWDYLIGRKLRDRDDHLHCVEVHRADVGEVKVMIAKKAALDRFLVGKPLGKLPSTFHWISTDGPVYFPGNAREVRQLALAGILAPQRVLDLN